MVTYSEPPSNSLVSIVLRESRERVAATRSRSTGVALMVLLIRETPGAAADAGKAAQEAAEQLKAAFERLGVVSSTALAEQAANARRDYETIKQSGVATAEDLAAAFKKSAEDAIAANKGVAPSWVEAEAAGGLREPFGGVWDGCG